MLASSGEITAPCPVPIFENARLEPFLDQADHAPVADPVLHELDDPFLAHRVEERADVGVQYVVHLLALDPDNKRIHRIMRAAPGSESVREPEEVFLVDRVEHRSCRPLDDLAFQGRHIPVELHSWSTNLWDRLR